MAGCGLDAADTLCLQYFQGLPEQLLNMGYTIQSHGTSIEMAMLELMWIETQLKYRRGLQLGGETATPWGRSSRTAAASRAHATTAASMGT